MVSNVPRRILLICTGNTCRSSMAEVMLKEKLRSVLGEGVNRIEVSSAGTGAFEGDRAPREAIEVMKARGLDVTGHKARRLTLDMAGEADFILTMTAGHKKAVLDFAPEMGGRVFTLKETDIQDPIGRPLDVYEKCAAEIDEALGEVVAKIKMMLEAEEAREKHEGGVRE